MASDHNEGLVMNENRLAKGYLTDTNCMPYCVVADFQQTSQVHPMKEYNSDAGDCPKLVQLSDPVEQLRNEHRLSSMTEVCRAWL